MALTDNLLAFYKLDDTNDSSGYNRTLTNNGNVSFASGKIGNAAVFDGTNSLEKAPFNIGQNFTVSFWANLNEVIDYGWLLLQYGGFCIYTRQDGSIEVGDAMSWNFATASGVVETGVWKHYCLSVSNGVGTLYANNSVLGNSEGNAPLDLTDTGDRPFGIGGESVSNNGYINGSMDAVGVWNRGLSQAEVAELYNNGTGLELEVPNLNNGLQAFYKLSDTSDSSGNNRTLTNNGNVSFASGKIGNAAVFNGTNSLEKAPFNIGQNFTVSFWANPNEIKDYGWLLIQYGGFVIYTRADGSLEVGDAMSWNFATASGVVETGVWKHYCLSVSNGVGTLYANNSVLGNSEGNAPLDLTDTGDRPFGIGGESVTNNGYFNGSMDAVGVWNRALSQAEVAELYNSGNGLELALDGWINNIFWIDGVATSLDQNGDGKWQGKLYEDGALFSGTKYSLTYVDGLAQPENIVTVIGTSIPVAFGLNEAEEPLVELVFASITSAGETVIEQIIPTVLPTGYTVAETVLAYSIDTTATFEGTINVDFILPSNISQAVFDRVKGFHVKDNGSIEEMTRVSSDFSTKRITVAITSFSDFLFLDEPASTGKLVKIQGKSKFYGNVKFGV